MIRVADRIMEYLADRGVTDVFVVSGGGAIFLDDALAQSERIRYYCCHHEQAVAMASEGYARVKGDIGVSVVTTGPGGTNAITGVAGSWIDSVPHLVISGQVYLNQTIRNTGLRQLGVQEINIIDLVKPITKYAVMIEEPRTALYHIQKAIHIATTGRPGPVWIDIPADICNTKLKKEEFEIFEPGEGDDPSTAYDDNLNGEVKRVVTLLRDSKRPLMHIGHGVGIAGALDDFAGLVEKHRIPFVTSRNANQYVDWDHELYAGRPGTFAQRGANFAIQNADVYIAVGTRLSFMQTGYNSKAFARNAVKVMVDVDKAELEKDTLAIDIKVHGDAKKFLTELTNQLDGIALDTAAWVRQCQEWRTKYPVVHPEYRTQETPVNSYYFIDVLSDVLDKDDVVVTDMGLAFQSTHQAFRIKKGQKLFTNSGFAAMGWGLPAAIGACIAHDKKRVICIVGDGGLQMNIQEMATIMHNSLPVKIFVYNNGGYLTIRQTQELGFDGRLMGCSKETGLSFPNVVKIGEANNIRGVRIDNQKNLKEKVQEIIDYDGPVICDLVMDPDQPQIPKVINRRTPDGKTVQSSLEDMYPFLDEEEMKANMVAEK